jgi:acetyltransferase-like isoleucine patch superfamily enzyme
MIIEVILNKIYALFLRANKSIHFDGKVHIKNRPIIDVRNEGILRIGDNVSINSKNKTYHINMFAPVKIFSRIKGSVIIIGRNTRIHGSCIHANERIEIGENCLIAANCQIFDNSGHDIYSKNRLDVSTKSKPILIEDNVWVGMGCIIMPGSIIGEGSVIAAGSVVRGIYKKNTLISGNPAIAVKTIST